MGWAPDLSQVHRPSRTDSNGQQGEQMKAKPPDQRKKIIYLRVTEAEHKEFVAAAWKTNRLLSAWIRDVLNQKVGKELGV